MGQARAFLDFLLKAAPNTESDYAHVLKDDADACSIGRAIRISSTSTWREENHPAYFHEFVDSPRASAAGPAAIPRPKRVFKSALDVIVKPEARLVLDALGSDRLRREQYLDFVRNRTFRQSLLCHADNSILNASRRADALNSLRPIALARPSSAEPDVGSDAPEEFESLTA